MVRKQVECGIDIINDGEQGRTDYTVHVMDRLTGYEGESAAPMGTGDEEFPELAQLLKQFASPFQHRPACNGPVDWKDWPAALADITRAKQATSGAKAEETFMTSPSPGQIARYLKNRYYKTEEAYVYALADVMRREYTAIVEAGFVLQLDCPDLAMLRHMVYLDKSLSEFRKIIAVNVAALNHAVHDLPPDRMRMHVCWGSTVAPHHTDVELKDIIDIVLSARPQAVSFPGANPRHEHEWKIWRAVKLPPGKIIIPGVIEFDLEFRRAPGAGGRPHRELRERGWARERDRRRRLRLRHLCGPRAGGQQDRVDEARRRWPKARGGRRRGYGRRRRENAPSIAPFPLTRDSPHILEAMAKPPKKPKDPAHPTRAKAARPRTPATPAALADLLNPAINKGTAGWARALACSRRRIIRSTAARIFPPPTRRASRRARDSAKRRRAITPARRSAGLIRRLARELGIGDDDDVSPSSPEASSPSPRLRGEGRGEGQASSAEFAEIPAHPDRCAIRPLPARREEVKEEKRAEVKKDDPKYRLPRADLPTQGGGISGFGGMASQQSLEKLLREGRPEFSAGHGKVWMPHRPPRPEKSEGGKKLVIASDFEPKGDQPQAIMELVEGVMRHDRTQVLLGVTGSGKTFTMAKVIEATQRPAIVLAPNKTLAAQLYGEFKSFFPDNAVEYFVSYYDYYQPEAYVPRTDTYIEKESSINEQIDRMRHSATRSLLERDDVIIVASVSCIYGIGSVETYSAMTFTLKQGGKIDQRQLLADLVALQYKRSGGDFFRGSFRVRGDVIEIFPAHYEDRAWRLSLFGDEIESIHEFDPLTGQKTDELDFVKIYANSHYVTPRPTLIQAITTSRTNCANASRSSMPPAGCWKRNGSSNARCSTWK